MDPIVAWQPCVSHGLGFQPQDAGFPIPASAVSPAADFGRHPLRQFLEPFTTRNIQAVFGAEVERGV